MQWLRIISLRKQQESKDKFDDAIEEMGSAKAVFEELCSTLKDIRTEIAKAEEERLKNSVPPPEGRLRGHSGQSHLQGTPRRAHS
jgi:hypothetical protein